MSDTAVPIFHHESFTIGTPDPAPLPQKTPAEARARIDEINNDKSNPYWKGYPEAAEEMARLLELAGQSQSASSSPAAPTSASMSPEQARERVAAINANKEHPYWQGHSESVEEMVRLLQMAAGRSEGPSSETPTETTAQTPLELAFKDAVEELGVPQDEQDILRSIHTETQKANPPTQEEGEWTLRREWGAAYDAHLTAAGLVWNRLSPVLQQELTESGLANHPKVVTLFAKRGWPLLQSLHRIRAHQSGKTPVSQQELRDLYRHVYGTRPVAKVRG